MHFCDICHHFTNTKIINYAKYSHWKFNLIIKLNEFKFKFKYKQNVQIVACLSFTADLNNGECDRCSTLPVVRLVGKWKVTQVYGEQKPKRQWKNFGEPSVYQIGHVLFPVFVRLWASFKRTARLSGAFALTAFVIRQHAAVLMLWWAENPLVNHEG